jgi:hypothetical protein
MDVEEKELKNADFSDIVRDSDTDIDHFEPDRDVILAIRNGMSNRIEAFESKFKGTGMSDAAFCSCLRVEIEEFVQMGFIEEDEVGHYFERMCSERDIEFKYETPQIILPTADNFSLDCDDVPDYAPQGHPVYNMMERDKINVGWVYAAICDNNFEQFALNVQFVIDNPDHFFDPCFILFINLHHNCRQRNRGMFYGHLLAKYESIDKKFMHRQIFKQTQMYRYMMNGDINELENYIESIHNKYDSLFVVKYVKSMCVNCIDIDMFPTAIEKLIDQWRA